MDFLDFLSVITISALPAFKPSIEKDFLSVESVTFAISEVCISYSSFPEMILTEVFSLIFKETSFFSIEKSLSFAFTVIWIILVCSITLLSIIEISVFPSLIALILIFFLSGVSSADAIFRLDSVSMIL